MAGAVSLTSSGDLILGAGSLIDASSGAAIQLSGKLVGGSGGNIALIAENASPSAASPITSNGLVLGGALRSEGMVSGGALTIQTDSVIVGQNALVNGTVLPAGDAAPTNLIVAETGTVVAAGNVATQDMIVAAPLQLSADFFQQGFSSYSINGVLGLTVTPGTQITATEPVLEETGASLSTPTGGSAGVLQSWLPPLYQLNPANGTIQPARGCQRNAGGRAGRGRRREFDRQPPVDRRIRGAAHHRPGCIDRRRSRPVDQPARLGRTG